MTWSDTPCKLWDGRINEFGYGTIGPHLAHRRAWVEANGPIPDGMTIDHRCHDPNTCRDGVKCLHRRCVEVAHMELCSAAENKARGSLGWHFSDRTHCPAGHPYAGENLGTYKSHRHCKACKREKAAAWRAARKYDWCRAKGHEREERTKNGRSYCVTCIRMNQLAAARSRTRPS